MEDVKRNIREEFKKRNVNKDKIINYIRAFVDASTSKDVFKLKKYLETKLTKEISCTYMPLKTASDYGCDLREIFYNRKGDLLADITIRQDLLEKFKQKKDTECFHILTDIDDTLFAHPGGIAGDDYSWKKKESYPGVKEFYKQFYDTLHDIDKNYTTILSATPGFAKTLKLDNDALKSIIGEDYGFIQGEESKFKQASTIGAVFSSKQNQNRFEMYGNIKARRCGEYKSLFPEFKLIFIGDNGQGDLLAGKDMIDKNICEYVFIHNIMDNKGNFKESTKEEKYQNRIFFFKNYLQLAHIFKDLNIFTQDNVRAISNSIEQNIDDYIYTQKGALKLPIQTLINSFEEFKPSPTPVLGFVGGKNKKRTRKGRKMNKKTRTRKIMKK